MNENSDEIQKLKDELAEKEKTIKKLTDIAESLITQTRDYLKWLDKWIPEVEKMVSERWRYERRP